MKLFQNNTTEIETSKQFKESSFGIRALDMGIILEILRSKMYSNPIAIICQEITSNARDANREAGNKNKPIRISLVDSIFRQNELDLVIEDDGPGISPERMTEIFIYYGASTKRETNGQTGGYGLGCKVPFAYTDTFSVVTKHDHVKYTYQAVIENNRSGKMLMVHSEPTTDCNGTAIIIPINKSDEEEFSVECHRATFFWPVKPIYTGLQDIQDKFPKIIKEDSMAVIAENSSLYDKYGYYALVDSIPYFLDPDLLNFTRLSRCSIFFKFKTGSVSIAASRESLHYDERTIKALKEKYSSYIKAELDELSKKVDTATCELQAKIFLAEKLQGPCREILKGKGIKWKEKEITTDLESMKIIEVTKYVPGTIGNKQYPSRIPSDLLTSQCVEMDMMNFSVHRNETLFKKANHFYAVGPQSDKLNAEYEEFKKLMGNNILLYSSVTYVRKKRDSVKKEPDEIHCHTISQHWRSSNHISKVIYTTDIHKHNAMYIVLERIRDLKEDDIAWYYMIQEISGYQAIIIRSKYISLVKSHWKSYEGVLKQIEPDLKELGMILKANRLKNIDSFRKLNFQDPITKELNYLYNLKRKSLSDHKVWGQKTFNAPDSLMDKYPVLAEFRKALQTYNEIFKKYPLLKFVERSAMTTTEQQEFDKYIALIDKEEIEIDQPQMAVANL
jgi:anti-sigma regulatory factor (Ser/Thr protein kinase)